MPDYISNLLNNIKHNKPKIDHAPHIYNIPMYKATTQFTPNLHTSPKLPDAHKQQIQKIIGSPIYYRREVDPTILVALSSLASQQHAPTEATAHAISKLLNYVAKNNNATIDTKHHQCYCAPIVMHHTCLTQKPEAEQQGTFSFPQT